MAGEGRKEWQEQENTITCNLILKALREKGGRLTFGQICAYAGRSRPVVSRHLKVLFKEGEVTRGAPNEWPRYYYLNINLVRLKEQFKNERQQLHRQLDAALKVIEQKRILRILGVDKESSVAEFRDIRAEVLHEMQRPKIGDLFEWHEKQKKEG